MDVVMPQLGETVREGAISIWHKRVGDAVRPEEPLFEVETDKVTVDVPAPAAGVLVEILVPVGERVEVGTRLAVIRVEGEASAGPAGAPQAEGARSASHAPTAAGGRAVPLPANSELRLSPVVRRLLAEHGIADPAVIRGTGAAGRVRRDDVLAYIARRGGTAGAGADSRGGADPRAGAPPTPAGSASPDAAGDTIVPMSRIRKLTAEHMVRSAATSPHVLQAVEVDFFAVDRLRSAAGDAWRAREGFALSYLPFVARAVCQAIPAFPHVNASVRGDSLVVHHRIHLGIAVDLDRAGLVVPVVRDAQARTVRELAIAIHRLAERARAGALSPDDFAEGTYTLSNSGSFGTLITAPIIHQPQVAILSTDGVRKRPVVVETAAGDAIAIRPVGVLAQCFDHRAFDGAYSAAFLGRVRQLLERGEFAAELA